MVYDLANAASHVSLTSLMLAVAPRSTRSHCGSAFSLLAQRVAVRLPSNAALAGNDDDSNDDAVAGLPWESNSGPPPGFTTVNAKPAECAAAADVPVTV